MQGSVQEMILGSSVCGAVREESVLEASGVVPGWEFSVWGREGGVSAGSLWGGPWWWPWAVGAVRSHRKHGPPISYPLGRGCVNAGFRPQHRRPEL